MNVSPPATQRHIVPILGALTLLLSALGSRSYGEDPVIKFHFINVGQGAATLIEGKSGVVLIDAGAQDEEHADKLVAYLNKVFDRRAELSKTIELLGVTHTHKDHNLALAKVVTGFTVKRYIDNGHVSNSGKLSAKWIRKQIEDGKPIQLREIKNADVLAVPARTGLTDDFIDPLKDVDDPTIKVLSGSRAEGDLSRTAFGNENNHSIVWRIDFGRVALLITGDLQEQGIHRLVGDYVGTRTLDVDLYEVGHHGSHNGTTQELIDAMTPTRAIFAVGKWDYGRADHNAGDGYNTYAFGHPRLNIVRLLEGGVSKTRAAKRMHAARGVRDFVTHTVREAVYGTGFDGNIVMTSKTDGMLTVQLDQ